MPRLKKLLIASTIAGFYVGGAALAQQQGQEQQVSQCMEDMHAMTLEMQEDGYWLAGYPRVTPPAHDPAAVPPTEPGVTGDPGVATFGR